MMKDFGRNINFTKNVNVDSIILKTIKDVLTEILGKKSYRNINESMKLYSIKWKEVPYNAEIFSNLLNYLLGPAYVNIEDLIIENIYEKIGLKYKIQNDLTFKNYIDELKNQWKE